MAAFELLGTPTPGGLLIVVDHASDHVPADIDLGIAPALLATHIAVDIGVAAIARAMLGAGTAAFLATASRLVCDLNREAHAPAIIPIASDGHAIPGNALDHAGHEARLARFYHPYHTALEASIAAVRPGLILSLHSFTPSLASHPQQQRPWHVGVLYNADERAPRLALPLLAAEEGLVVGDQQPYSGRLLNATMNRHAEGHGIPYLGVEVRQDLIADAAGQGQWAARLGRLCGQVMGALA
ncbi:MAG TPA: N-formylglutamate amidohydrolase [Novosphingobium sp.]|nr:N-formylglutamate amidohydrolase [Novosphingobium sp.]